MWIKYLRFTCSCPCTILRAKIITIYVFKCSILDLLKAITNQQVNRGTEKLSLKQEETWLRGGVRIEFDWGYLHRQRDEFTHLPGQLACKQCGCIIKHTEKKLYILILDTWRVQSPLRADLRQDRLSLSLLSLQRLQTLSRSQSCQTPVRPLKMINGSRHPPMGSQISNDITSPRGHLAFYQSLPYQSSAFIFLSLWMGKAFICL